MIYKQLSSTDPNADTLEVDAKKWVEDFVSFSHVFEGHHRRCVTPYMHIFAYHVPDQIREYGNIRQFSGKALRRITMMPNTTTIQVIDIMLLEIFY